MYVVMLTFLHVHCIFDIVALEKNGLLGQGDELFCATTQGFVVQSSKMYTKCDGKLNIQTKWGHIILDLKVMT